MPVLVVKDGEPIRDALQIERVSIDELLEGARQQGIKDLAEVKVGILEPDGRFSFLRNDGSDSEAANRPRSTRPDTDPPRMETAPAGTLRSMAKNEIHLEAPPALEPRRARVAR